MKAKYNIAKRLDPKTKSKKWYGVPASTGSMDADETAKMAVADTTLSKGEFKHAMEVASEKLMPLILGGISVTIGNLGKLRLSFGSKGVENIDEYDAATMIKNAKFIFTPSTEMKEALAKAQFELEGVVEDGVKYGSMKSYRIAKGLEPGVTVPGAGGEEDGEDGNQQLG